MRADAAFPQAFLWLTFPESFKGTKNEKAAQGKDSSISRLQSAVFRADKILVKVYIATWPHKHGGRGLLDDLGHQHVGCAPECVKRVCRLASTSFDILLTDIHHTLHCLTIW